MAGILAALAPILEAFFKVVLGFFTGPEVVGVTDARTHLDEFEDSTDDALLRAGAHSL